MPSQKANKYGTAAEYKMAEKYNLDLARCAWKDADAPDGTPVEIKSAMHEHADGQPGNFKIYEQYHDRLRNQGGVYVFAAYRIRGRGIEILADGRRRASSLPSYTWHGGGEHRDTRQAKLAIADVL